ncbi:hypothetical protein KFK09_017465 [Dendrobium nobile]|uniref:Uncharacterized protein n=1 Tax=Dendrobium nobile TaxID=94219 RepID=A0A8T3B3H7_DENNO|nr:hypothetical protein KFK09_017465 [Dendrobium nobile]
MCGRAREASSTVRDFESREGSRVSFLAFSSLSRSGIGVELWMAWRRRIVEELMEVSSLLDIFF